MYLCVRIHFPLPCVCVCLFLKKKKKMKENLFNWFERNRPNNKPIGHLIDWNLIQVERSRSLKIIIKIILIKKTCIAASIDIFLRGWKALII